MGPTVARRERQSKGRPAEGQNSLSTGRARSPHNLLPTLLLGNRHELEPTSVYRHVLCGQCI